MPCRITPSLPSPPVDFRVIRRRAFWSLFVASIITYQRAIVLVPALEKTPEEQAVAYLDAASEAIEEACGRGFRYEQVTGESARPDSLGRSWLWRIPVVPAAVTITENDGSPISFRLENETGELLTPGVGKDGVVKCSYAGGMSPIPPAVELAVANLAKRRIERDAQQGLITSKEIGSVKISYQTRDETKQVDDDILASIRKYVRQRLA